jgi:hypothetical protein
MEEVRRANSLIREEVSHGSPGNDEDRLP